MDNLGCCLDKLVPALNAQGIIWGSGEMMKGKVTALTKEDGKKVDSSKDINKYKIILN